MFQLQFGKHTFHTLKDFETEQVDIPDFAKAALEFCGAWLANENSFSQQTSGSTGTPKKIEISREQMKASAKATQAFFNTDENSLLLCCLDPSYIAGKMMLVRAMVWNCRIRLIEPKSSPLAGNLEIPDFVAMVPLQVEASIKDRESLERLKAIKHLIIGGAPISSTLKDQLINNGIQAYQTYGMTETVSHIALAKIEVGELTYEVLPEVEFGLDERNALWVKSDASNNHVIQTNDLVELTGTNSFRWLGRADFVINSGGVKLHPELLEAKAEKTIHRIFPESKFFFFSKKDLILGEKLCLAIESSDSSGNRDKLLSLLSIKLNKYEVPKNIYIISKFKRTNSGKINRPKTIEKL